MIVREESDGSLVLITQNDHAQASATFAAHWGNDRFARPTHRPAMIRAAMLHDFSWISEETNPAFTAATGEATHYTKVPSETQLEANRWTNEWVAAMDPYAGLLVAKHRTGIWKARYGLMRQPSYAERTLPAEVEAFITASHADQAEIAAPFDPAELTANYILLQMFDLFSLYICTNEILKPMDIDPVPTGYAPGATTQMRLTPEPGRRIAIDPYPFDQPELTVGVVHRRLAETRFPDADTFRNAYFAQPQHMMAFTFFDPT